MNRSDRLMAVLDLLAENGQIEVDDVVEALEVSPATVRRDLDTLAEQNLLTRTRGGAVGHSVSYDLPLRYKRGQRADEKAAIARVASELVTPGSVVGLCGGTTSTAVASELAARGDLHDPQGDAGLTVVTNAINIASQLALRPHIKVVVSGGVVHARSYELTGPYADEMLSKLSIDMAFIGVNGIDVEQGATVHDEGEARVNQLMAERAKHAVIVADSQKIGRRAFASVAPLDAFDMLITDAGADSDTIAAFTERGIDVRIAE
ncbi:DeoR/GlpR family DNA-binding transcription regulator [Paramicrobacterium fandaimingii]|uniref:DeoR/GlpR family DNA-binding transcription regulator n=1 Tax=Paramicrobacterium fandaimingii TaxID=2708079 RepID=UPI001421C1FB|nr:DeoR/GlpR family DNA-binding transcription regulator [Microbacterium fandaimingii]